MFMRTKKQLISLWGIYTACVNAADVCNTAYKFERENKLSFDNEKKSLLRSECYSKVGNILSSINNNRSLFINSKAQLQYFIDFISKPVDIPEHFEKMFSDVLSDERTVERVLRVARNVIEHPDKNDQIKYLYLADTIDFSTIYEALALASVLVEREINNSTDEERRIMVAESYSLGRFVFNAQKQLRPVLEVLKQDERASKGNIEILEAFLAFCPSSENVKIDKNIPGSLPFIV